MGRLSKQQKADLVHRYTESIDNITDAIVKTGKFVATEGITISFGLMCWRITGKVYRYDDDGNETPSWAIRSAVIDGMFNLRKIMVAEIPLIGIAPLAWQEPILRAYESLLIKVGSDDKGYYFEELPIMERLELCILLPALLRTMFALMGKLLDVG